MTIKEIVSAYIDGVGYKLAPRTLESYRYLLLRYCRDVELTPINIESCYRQLLTDHKERTAEAVYKLIRAASKRALRYRLIDEDCTRDVDPVRHRQQMRDYWSIDEARAFLRATEGTEHHLAWLLMLGLGLRRGEACGLRWIDVELIGGYVNICNQRYRIDGRLVDAKPKSRTSSRRLKIDEHMRQELIERRKAHPEAVYVIEESPEHLRAAFRAACRAARVRPIPLHGLRHTFATTAIEEGESLRVLQVVMGHASYQVTESHYAHVTARAMDQAVGGVSRAFHADS